MRYVGNNEKKTYVQCTRCGNIHHVNEYIPFEKNYIYLYCQECDNDYKHINLGDDESDIYLYADINIDKRYL